jgi:hypothetical protein
MVGSFLQPQLLFFRFNQQQPQQESIHHHQSPLKLLVPMPLAFLDLLFFQLMQDQ